ncbi:MAG: hypothetical protein QOJ83_1221, partial [Frankiales bacterium]|nr:hypothetical protein [Frankiales bacterium]
SMRADQPVISAASWIVRPVMGFILAEVSRVVSTLPYGGRVTPVTPAH